jgi:hypothetical protein
MSTRVFSSLSTLILLSGILCDTTFGQSGIEYQRTGIMNGNQVRTVFGNWGVIGQPASGGPRGAWKNDNDGYLGDVSPLVGAEVRWLDTTFHSVVTSPVDRPTQLRDEDPLTGKPWTFQPIGGYLNPNQQKIANSGDPTTWPPYWPDKLGDASDPGWRNESPDNRDLDPNRAAWNGFFGKNQFRADQESYFAMDDNNDLRFNIATNNTRGIAFKPDPAQPNLNGLGLQVTVRALQWAQFLAKDNIFWLYEIRNTGKADYNRVVFGMIVGTYVGVTGTDDRPQEYDDDWSFYDVNQNITYTGDYGRNVSRNARWVGPVGMVGYAFLESPGNPFDGLDNDGDADSNAIGVTAPRFTNTDFDSVLITAGMRIVLINDDFSRVPYTVPNDTVTVYTRGRYFLLRPGITRVSEGNILRDVVGNEFINPNAYDGVDNDFDGIIDENTFLHYRQLKRTRTTPPVTLIDVLRPVRYVGYLTGQGASPLSMIDESRTDRVDNDQDWDIRFDDVGRDGIAGTGDFGEGDGVPTSGIDANGNDTGLPGEPNIDKTDVSESDQIGLTSFYYFTPANVVVLGDDESLWRNLAPGFFDVPQSIVNNRPQRGEDGDFIYGSGYFPLLAGRTERFSLALVYGGGKGGSVEDDINDLLKNKATVQKIYDANYQFPQPPDKPTLVAVPGDHQVTLYWDRRAEESIDPVLRVKDFEGYKIYRSTDPDFSDIFTITDATGSPQGYRPLAQFDAKNGITGFFRPSAELFAAASGYSFFLGDDTGLQHTFVDRDVTNGQRYFYAVVAYDRGDELIGIFPGENTKFVSILPSGQVVIDQNVAVVVPNTKSAGYVNPLTGETLTHLVRRGTGEVVYNVVDETKVSGHRYRVEFLDTEVDGIDNNNNGLIDQADSTESDRLTSFYFVRDLEPVSEKFISQDTARVFLSRQNLVPSTVSVRTVQGSLVDPAAYLLDAGKGEISGATPGSLPAASYTITYEYYPVYRSPLIRGTPFVDEAKDADIFDGVQLSFDNFWYVKDTLAQWTGPTAYLYSLSPLDIQLGGGEILAGIRVPYDYELQFSNTVVDTSLDDPLLFVPATPVNFRLFNLTDSTYEKFVLAETNPVPGSLGRLSPGDELVLRRQRTDGSYFYTWSLRFSAKPNDPPDTIYTFTTGDRFVVRTTKPFRQGDIMEFTTTVPRVEEQLSRDQLVDVRVVPNPYVTASEFELPLNPGVTSGRGERRIDFTNVPAGSTIRIFTSRGDHVATLVHNGNIENGTVSWNLRTKENLDVAFGVYFYVLESPVGNKTGKIAIIK